MAETADPASTPGELPKQAAEPTDALAAPTSTSAEDSTFSAVDVSLPPIDKSLPAMDTPVTSVDTTLPPLDPSIPSLPPIDTSLPPIDTTLPATDGGLGTDTHFSFDDPDPKHDDGGLGGPEPTTHVSATPGSNIGEQPGPSPAPDSSWQLPSNGTHSQHLPPLQNQSVQPQSQSQYQQPQQQQQQHAPSQQYQPQQPQQQGQMQSQPQSQQYQQQSSDMYHNHQASSAPMNAPSMQTMDHHSTQGQTSHVPQAPIGSPMPPMASVGQYMTGYPNNVGQMGMNSSAQMRYQLPGDPNKMLSGGRHKKEVKRRTKTGCLTCRKRRIKCDEGHPVCRNCVKSKRECLGYDPVFKQQPTPSAIQPAPNPHPSLVVNPQDPSTSSSTPTYPSAPPGYVPAVSQPFAPSESPSTSTERYDYGAQIDPTLDGNNSSNMASVQNAVEGGLQPTVNPANTTTSSDPTSFRVKQVQISDLLALRGIPPPPPHPITAIQPNRLEEIKAVFLATYAPAIDKFFETRWFQEKALTHLLANAQLMAEYSALIEAFNDQNLNDPNVIARLESFEASVVWSSMTLCRHVMNVSNGSHGQDYDLLAASKRLDVIEAMITGEHLDSNPLAQFPPRETPTNPPCLSDQLAQRSLDFWSAVGHFLTLHDNEASSAKEIDDTLGRCRTLLDTFENRDVIYSIAIARHLGQRWADFPRSFPQPITTNEKDAGAKLYVAQKFLEQEAGGKGTTQVIKRICGMVVRSWFVSRE
ncbi:hypothetical protein BDV32DRAFT_126074 [Aspergillus pseudonomiae]|uniref:Uncharacterized protein n=1 Tax=Aspergillus pseudonomiae TaxID=1506151 RepID=A0A5N7DC81_9EURO|nr:uncharacterized protein BDV37DRAFT_122197 [Aspergillus pseudonomiae]KAB8258249.1 hypothetical protein BDV32DRAFT_126074 [Aspergillus pseudonomiae]KAE8404002.1 hypothetical protein BDV37DRAFT_122197 [Aspergillus pseudonomiae]